MTEQEQEPIIFQHALSLYQALVDQSTNGRFTGSKIALFRSLGLSNAHYSRLFDALTELGCIEQVQRGSKTYPSIIVLHKPPALEEFRTAYRTRLTRPSSDATMRKRMDDLEGRIAALEIFLLGGEVHTDGETTATS